MTVLFKAAGAGSVSPIFENLDAQQFVLEANMGTGGIIVWEVSNVTPYTQLTPTGDIKSLTGFQPTDADFVPVKTPAISGLSYLNGGFRWMRFRVLSGVVNYAAFRAYAPNEAFPGAFLEASDVETIFLNYQFADTGSVVAYSGRSKVLWITTGGGRGMYLRDDASAAVPTIVGSSGQKWFKVTT